VKGGAFGYAGAALLGPLGWAAGAAAAYFSSKSDEEKFNRAADRWDNAVNDLAEATDRWADAAQRHFRTFYEGLVAAIDQAVAATGDSRGADAVLACMVEDMQEEDDDGCGPASS